MEQPTPVAISGLLSPPTVVGDQTLSRTPSPRLGREAKAALVNLCSTPTPASVIAGPGPEATVAPTSSNINTEHQRHGRKLSQIGNHTSMSGSGDHKKKKQKSGELTMSIEPAVGHPEGTTSYYYSYETGLNRQLDPNQVVVPASFTPGLGYHTKIPPSIKCNRSPKNKKKSSTDKLAQEVAELTADPNLSEEDRKHIEVNVRRISRESASPTLKGSNSHLSVGNKSIGHSVSGSLSFEEQLNDPTFGRPREDCVSLPPTPLDSPMSLSKSSNLQAPEFSLSDSTARHSQNNLLSPSNVSSGCWEPPEPAVPVLVPKAPTLAVEDAKKKSTPSWKFWKKDKKDDPVDDKANKSTVISAPAAIGTTLPASLPSMQTTPATHHKIDTKKAQTLPATAAPVSVSVTTKPIQVSPPPPKAPPPIQTIVPAAVKPPTPKNKKSPTNAHGRKGSQGAHKRQKSRMGDDVHSSRSGPPNNLQTKPIGTNQSSQRPASAAPTAILAVPVKIPPRPTSATPAVAALQERKEDPKMPIAVEVSSVGIKPKKERKKKKVPIDIDSEESLLASLIASGLMDEDSVPAKAKKSTNSSRSSSPPPPPEPQNSYEDSFYEPLDTPKPPVRPIQTISSWTRTTTSPHIQPPTNSTPGSSRVMSPTTSPPISPRRGSAPSSIIRTGSMIVCSPTTITSASHSVTPLITPSITPARMSPCLGPMSSPVTSQTSELRQIISGHSLGYYYFLRHLQREYASESLLFWKVAEDFLPLAAKEWQAEMEEATKLGSHPNAERLSGFSLIYLTLYEEYLKPGAKHEINISSSLRELLKKDAAAHQLLKPKVIASWSAAKEPQVQRNPQALNQSSLNNLNKIEPMKDEHVTLQQATLVENPLLSHLTGKMKYQSATPETSRAHSSQRQHQPQSSLSDIQLDDMRLDVDGPVPSMMNESAAVKSQSPPAITPQTGLAYSTYLHLLQSQNEIERLLTQDCLPRFKHSPGYEKWIKYEKPASVKDSPEPTISAFSSLWRGFERGGMDSLANSTTSSPVPSKPSSPLLQPIMTTAVVPGLPEKRNSCLLPISTATSFTNNSSPSTVSTSGIVESTTVIKAEPQTTAATNSTSSLNTVPPAATVASTTIVPLSTSTTPPVVATSKPATPAIQVSGPTRFSTRCLTVSASAFAQAAAVAQLQQQRMRNNTQTEKPSS